MAGKKYNDATRRYDRSMMHDPEQGVPSFDDRPLHPEVANL